MIGEISGITMHSDSKEVMKITRDGIWVSPDVSVDEAAKTVLAAIDKNILFLLEKERERERERCAKLCEKESKSYMSKQYTTDPLGGFRERFAAEQCAAAIRGMR